jgi:hypothetical protein
VISSTAVLFRNIIADTQNMWHAWYMRCAYIIFIRYYERERIIGGVCRKEKYENGS